MNAKIANHPSLLISKKEFAKRLNYQMGLSRFTGGAELGRATDITRDRIAKYLRGASLPRPEKIKALADALGCLEIDLLPEGSRATMVSAKPGYSLNGLAGMPGHTHIVVNMTVPTSIALKVATLLNEIQED